MITVRRSALSRSLAARRGLLTVSAAALLWGTTGVVVIRLHDHGLSALSIGFYRLLVATVVLSPVLAAMTRDRWRTVLARRRGVVVAGAGLAQYQACYFLSVTWVGVSVATLVSLGVAPVALIAVGAARSRRLPAWSTSVIAICALVGLALVSVFGGQHGHSAPHPALGILAAVASGLGYAGTTVVSHRLTEQVPALTLTALTSAIGAVTLLPIAALVGSGLGFSPDARSLLQLGYIGAGATALAYALFYTGLRSTPSDVASVLTLIEPLTASVLAVGLLGEPFSAAGVLGALLLVVAVAGLYLRPAVPPVELGV